MKITDKLAQLERDVTKFKASQFVGSSNSVAWKTHIESSFSATEYGGFFIVIFSGVAPNPILSFSGNITGNGTTLRDTRMAEVDDTSMARWVLSQSDPSLYRRIDFDSEYVRVLLFEIGINSYSQNPATYSMIGDIISSCYGDIEIFAGEGPYVPSVPV